jgi:hypothetical protein
VLFDARRKLRAARDALTCPSWLTDVLIIPPRALAILVFPNGALVSPAQICTPGGGKTRAAADANG